MPSYYDQPETLRTEYRAVKRVDGIYTVFALGVQFNVSRYADGEWRAIATEGTNVRNPPFFFAGLSSESTRRDAIDYAIRYLKYINS